MTHAIVIIGNYNIPNKTTKASVNTKTVVPKLSISGGIVWISNVILFNPSTVSSVYDNMSFCSIGVVSG